MHHKYTPHASITFSHLGAPYPHISHTYCTHASVWLRTQLRTSHSVISYQETNVLFGGKTEQRDKTSGRVLTF